MATTCHRAIPRGFRMRQEKSGGIPLPTGCAMDSNPLRTPSPPSNACAVWPRIRFTERSGECGSGKAGRKEKTPGGLTGGFSTACDRRWAVFFVSAGSAQAMLPPELRASRDRRSERDYWSAFSSPGTRPVPSGTVILAPWKSSPMGSERPPRCFARNCSVTA